MRLLRVRPPMTIGENKCELIRNFSRQVGGMCGRRHHLGRIAGAAGIMVRFFGVLGNGIGVGALVLRGLPPSAIEPPKSRSCPRVRPGPGTKSRAEAACREAARRPFR